MRGVAHLEPSASARHEIELWRAGLPQAYNWTTRFEAVAAMEQQQQQQQQQRQNTGGGGKTAEIPAAKSAREFLSHEWTPSVATIRDSVFAQFDEDKDGRLSVRARPGREPPQPG